MTIDGRAVRRLLLLVAVVLVLVGAGVWAVRRDDTDRAAPPAPGDPERVRLDGFDEVAVTVDPGDGGDLLAWCLLAALSAQQRGRGLMEVTDLQGYSGMVFAYDEDVTNRFYMRNTPTPLSIAWVAADGEVVTIDDMAPCEDRDGCPTYAAAAPYRYAIEVFQGDLDELGITEAATVTVGGRCASTS